MRVDAAGPRWTFGAVAAIYGLLGAALHRHLLPALGSRLYDQAIIGHDSLIHVWSLAWGQHALRHDPGAVWNAPIFHPSPGALLFSDHLLGLAVLLAPLRALTDDVVLLHNLVIVVSPLLNGLAVYALALALTNDRFGAFAAGLVYAFAPFRAATDLNQIQMLVAWWPPVMLLAVRRTLESGRPAWALAAGFALAAQGATGIYVTAYFAPFLALAHLWWLRAFPLRRHIRPWTRLGVAELAALAALAPTALAYRTAQAHLGSTRSPVLNALLSTPPSAVAEHLALASLAVPIVAAIVYRARVPAPWRRELPLALAIAFGAMALALGPLVALPTGANVAGPYALIMGLPGFDALRAPGRMLHVAVLGTALLAGAGIAALRAAWPRSAGRVVITAVLAGFLWQAAPGPPLVGRVPRHGPHSVYAWLRDHPEVRAVAEIPLGLSPRTEQTYQWAGTVHWRPIVNGNMGVKPLLHAYLTRRLRAFPADDVLPDLAALGVTHLVVHETALRSEQRDALARLVRGASPALVERHRAGSVAVHELHAGAAPRPVVLAPALPRSAWRVAATENDVDAPLAVDGSAATAWSSWGGLEDLVRAGRSPVPFLDRWRAFLERQPARLAVDLGASTTVQAVSFRLTGSEPDALGQLELHGSDDGLHWRPIAARLRALPDVRAALRPDAPFAFVFDAPTDVRWLRLGCHGLEWHAADLHAHPPA